MINMIPNKKVISSPEDAPAGWSAWIENGVWFSAPTVDGEKFGPHDYEANEYLHDCKCGCFMSGFSSDGPVNPFGPCPLNPKPDKTELLQAIDAMEKDLARHVAHNDEWYSCPKADGGCTNKDITDCTCGADQANERQTKLCNALRKAVEQRDHYAGSRAPDDSAILNSLR